jgi:hypothetical protein
MQENHIHEPATLSRRGVLSGAANCACVAAVLRVSQAMADAPKMKQSDVAYQPGPNGGKSCNQCSNWQPPNACKLVSGEISPSGWCSLFKAKG